MVYDDIVVDLSPDPIVLREAEEDVVLAEADTDVVAPDAIDVLVEEAEDPHVFVDDPEMVFIQEGVVGLTGPEGPQGPAGADGTGDLTYTHSQGTASTVWTIDHNLGKRPSVDLVDSAWTKMYAGVEYPTLDRVVVTFAVPVAGYAYLN